MNKPYNVWNKGVVDYKVDICGKNTTECGITLLDANRNPITTSDTCSGQLRIPNAIPWWPFMSGKKHIAYLYTLEVPNIFWFSSVIFVFGKNNNTRCIFWVLYNFRWKLTPRIPPLIIIVWKSVFALFNGHRRDCC